MGFVAARPWQVRGKRDERQLDMTLAEVAAAAQILC
jgi:hypothetical protein